MKRGRNRSIASTLSGWMGAGSAEKQAGPGKSRTGEGAGPVGDRPIEPRSGGSGWPGIAKWIVFVILIGYSVMAYYRVPILISLGRYLILEHPLKRADMIVCTPGHQVEQALMAADLYRKGLAPRIFVPEETPPDGLQTLRERGGASYPWPDELFVRALLDLNVPESALVSGERPADSLREEAVLVRALAMENGYRSIIVVTSPARARRTHLIFEKAFEGQETKIMISPSRYSGFRADNWWQREKYVDRLVLEYLKMVYQKVRDLL